MKFFSVFGFLVFMGILGGAAYLFYTNSEIKFDHTYKDGNSGFQMSSKGSIKFPSPKIKVETTTAEAATQPEEAGNADLKETVSVKISQEFPAVRSKNLELSSYYNMSVKFAETDGDKVIVSLIGEGTDYKNDGQRLADWFKVSSAGTTLKFKSFDKSKFSAFESMKDLAKSLKGEKSESKFTMIVEYPEGFTFEKIKLQVVTSDVFADELEFDSFSMSTVSGNIRLKESKGKEIKIESVSGDSNVEIAGLNKARISSVSGDAVIKCENSNPDVQFESVSGNLNLKIPEDSQLEVSFESMTGDLINDFGVSNQQGKKLKFSSLSGSAEIHKIK